MSVAIRSYLVSWLQQWLQIKDLRELGKLEVGAHTDSVAKIDFGESRID